MIQDLAVLTLGGGWFVLVGIAIRHFMPSAAIRRELARLADRIDGKEDQ